MHVNGEAQRSCQIPASAIQGRKVTTIEGLSAQGNHPLQRAWQELDVPAQRVLFVDDNAINVEAAARLGMHTRRVQGVDGARRAFVELGLVSEDAP